MPVLDFIRDAKFFDTLAGINEETFVNWNNGEETRPIFGAFTTKNYFAALGVPVAYGRGILPDDPDQVVVLHNRFWRRNFNADPAVVGRTMNLDGKSYTIIGILPPGHRTLTGSGLAPDVFLPSYIPDMRLQMYARLTPGMHRGEALAGLRTIADRMDPAMPTFFKYSETVQLSPIAGFARVSGDDQALTIAVFFAILLVVAGLVLLISCVNVAGLLLARASARKREIAIRLSLGAGRGRLLQQLMVESLLLALAGAGCGLALAQTLTTFAGRIQLPLPVPIQLDIEPDWRLAIYAVVLTVGAALTSGLLPAWQSLRESISPNLHRERKMRLRKTLVTAQVAISLIVLAAGLLFLRSLLRATAISPEFDLLHTAQAEVYLPPAAYHEGSRILQYVDRAITEVSAIPGVEAAAASRTIPFQDASRFGGAISFADNGERVPTLYYWNAVTPGYFAAMGIPLVRGRVFSEADRVAERPVLVNPAFVTQFLRGREPLGTIFRRIPQRQLFRIIGVVEGTKTMTIGEDPQPQLYELLQNVANEDARIVRLVIRSSVPPVNQLNAIREALRRVEPDAGLEVATVYSSIGLAFLPSQVGAVLMGSIGLLGLLLAAIGLYGSMVYSVTRRTREIGVRVAVGATPRDVSRMILLDAAKLMFTGSAIGIALAFFAVKPLAMFLVPGLQPADPTSFLAVLIVLAVTGLLASWGPVRRLWRSIQRPACGLSSDMLGLNMRPLLVSACLFFAALVPGQTTQPNAVKLTKYILGVADLDRSFAFYHALGLDLQNKAPALTAKPNTLNDALRGLVDVPPGTKFRNMMLKIPDAAFPIEVTEFAAMEVHAARPRIQDPGAALLVLDVDDVDAALAVAKKAGGEIVTTGGKPVTRASGAGRAVTVKDPDGYYVELAQTTAMPSGSGKVIGATFGSMVVQSSEKAAAFYRDHFGFAVKTTAWSSNFDANLGTPGAQLQTAEVTVPGTTLSWRFIEFKGVDRKSYTPRIPDPGAAGIGLQVHDMDAAIAAMKAAGGSSITQDGNVKLGNGKVGFVRDPNGILVELAQN